MAASTKNSYSFGDFRIDISERQLWRKNELVPLTPKVFDTLVVLVQSGGRLVTKDELMKGVWQDTFVEESNLSNNIYALRKILDQGEGGRGYIETVPRHGYRFVAEVRESPGHAEEAAPPDGTSAAGDAWRPPESAPDVEPGEASPAREEPAVASARGRYAKTAWMVALALTVAVVVGVAALLYSRASGRRDARAGGRVVKSVAVLPFRPLGKEGADPHLGLGMTDAVITKLSGLQQVTVRPTSAVFRYEGGHYDSARAGRELGVDVVLEGTVQRDGEDVRVSVQLIDVAEARPVWAERFDEKFTDIFAIQDVISAHVAEALRLRLTGEDRGRLAKRYTDNVEAYQAYVRGNYFWNKRTEAGMRSAISHFKEAIRLDPKYALAHAALADAYAITAYYGYVNIAGQDEAYGEAKAAAAEALRLDGDIAEAYVALALIESEHDGDDAEADAAYKRALALNPDSALALHRYGVFLLERGRVDEAEPVTRRASELDPLSPVIGASYCSTSYFKRKYEEAIRCSRKILEVEPDYVPSLFTLGLSLGQMGGYGEAAEVFERMRGRNLSPTDRVELLRSIGYVYASAGHVREARGALAELDELSRDPQHVGAHFSKALVHVGLGEMDEAFRVLESRAPHWQEEPLPLRIDPRYDRLRADPRYAQLLKRRFGAAS